MAIREKDDVIDYHWKKLSCCNDKLSQFILSSCYDAVISRY